MSEKESQAPTSAAACPNPAVGRSPQNCSNPYLCPHDGFDGSFELLGVVVVHSPHVGLPNEFLGIRVLGGHLEHSNSCWILQFLLEWLLDGREEQQPHSHSELYPTAAGSAGRRFPLNPAAPQPQGDVLKSPLAWDAPFPTTLSSFCSLDFLHAWNTGTI